MHLCCNFGKSFACKAFSQKPHMLLLWNFTHLLDIIKCPFLDLEILVKVLHATTLRVNISWCIALQLYTTLPNHHTYVDYQDNSILDLLQVIAIFLFWDRVLHAMPFLTNSIYYSNKTYLTWFIVIYYQATISVTTVDYSIKWPNSRACCLADSSCIIL